MMFLTYVKRAGVLLALLLGCAGCGSSAAQLPTAPTATIATARLVQASPPPAHRGVAPAPPTPTSPVPLLTPSPTLPPYLTVATPTAAAAESQFIYLWPGYLPSDMELLAQESRVAQANEFGVSDLGFYIITFGAGQQKVVVGGGSIEPFELLGQQQQITVNGQAAVLTGDNQQVQVEFNRLLGKQFVYGYGVSQDELLRIAESLAPIPVEDLRQRVSSPAGGSGG